MLDAVRDSEPRNLNIKEAHAYIIKASCSVNVENNLQSLHRRLVVRRQNAAATSSTLALRSAAAAVEICFI